MPLIQNIRSSFDNNVQKCFMECLLCHSVYYAVSSKLVFQAQPEVGNQPCTNSSVSPACFHVAKQRSLLDSSSPLWRKILCSTFASHYQLHLVKLSQAFFFGCFLMPFKLGLITVGHVLSAHEKLEDLSALTGCITEHLM